MDLLTAVLLACSLHPDQELVHAIIKTSSGGNPYFVGYVAPRPIVFEQPTALPQAQAAFKVIVGENGKPSLGVMALPSSWAETFNRRPEDLWDSCTNVSIGTAKLADFDYQCRRKRLTTTSTRRPGGRAAIRSPQNRVCILRRYAAEIGFPSTFVGMVMSEINSAKSAASTPLRESLPSPGPGWSEWIRPSTEPDVP
jgi:hypothetical protein